VPDAGGGGPRSGRERRARRRRVEPGRRPQDPRARADPGAAQAGRRRHPRGLRRRDPARRLRLPPRRRSRRDLRPGHQHPARGRPGRPPSPRTGGSILGDKPRVGDLTRSDSAFARPSPTAGTLGGVARRTREAMLLCEAAGFDVVMVETVGVGQSEVAVAGMVDLFAVLVAPGAGDELQGIKRGIIELADVVVVNKNDGELAPAAKTTATDYSSALRLVRSKTQAWTPRVVLVSALEGTGIDDLWSTVEEFRSTLDSAGELG